MYDSYDVSPDGTKMVFSAPGHGGKDLYLLDFKTSRVTRLTDTPDYENYPAFAPNGRSIVYESARSLEKPRYLFIRSLNGKSVRQVTRGTFTDDEHPYFSRDGERIVFSRGLTYYPQYHGEDTWDHFDVYTVQTNGMQLRRLTHMNSSGVPRPMFSPDGTYILFDRTTEESDNSDSTNIARIDVRGKGPIRTVVHFQPDSFCPYFFPDGKRIVFASNDGRGRVDLYTIPISGGTPKPLHLIRNDIGAINPVITADGKTIFYMQTGIWRVNADGTHARIAAPADLFSDPLHWKPGT